MKSVYLAGPITGLNYDSCNGWREETIEKLSRYDIKGLSPLKGESCLLLEDKIADEYDTNINNAKAITTRDRFLLNSCDIMLANLLGTKNITVGTMIEYGWADAARKPIITVIEKEGNPHDHAIVREISGYRVDTLEEGLRIAIMLLDC
ncbi:nucleoside 2-deoxyribosyltransferase [Candidatus Woesearchaeota archaeon]|nr:nucleoside 2-deoxyribosyltransferase [Candidatus Woesearchaeota archaeon]